MLWRVCVRLRPSPQLSTTRSGWDGSLVFLTIDLYRMGAYDQAIAAAQRALAFATASGDVILHALTNQSLGDAYQAHGDYRQAIACFEQTMAFLDESRRYERFGELCLSRCALPCLARLVPC